LSQSQLPYSQYRFKFYFNASHAIYTSGNQGEAHHHTWEVTINTLKIQNSFVPFHEIEKEMETFLSRFQDVHINTVSPFKTINPTLENLGNYLKEQIQKILYDRGWLLLSIEISETPARSYIINLSDELETKYDTEVQHATKNTVEKMAEEKFGDLSTKLEKLSADPLSENNAEIIKEKS